MCTNTSKVRHSESLETHLTLESLIPRNLMFGMNVLICIVTLQDLKAGILQSLDNIRGRGEGGQSISYLNALLDTDVVFVIRIVTAFGQDNPVIGGKESSLLQTVVDAGEAFDPIRTVTSCLNGISNIETLLLKLFGQLLKITLYQTCLTLKALLCTVLIPNFDLIIINRHTGNIRPGKLMNIAHRPADATSDIKCLLLMRESSAECEVVFGAVDGFLKCFAFFTWCKVEGLSPAVFVEVGDEVVE
mmetsp:Transcript_24578/g.30894  ORF Transcript_24578/g.30894 Transcript_24578/m.30894 type:complete len:246 (-) Transcript_24578:415-1152(-)